MLSTEISQVYFRILVNDERGRSHPQEIIRLNNLEPELRFLLSDLSDDPRHLADAMRWAESVTKVLETLKGTKTPW